MSRSTSHHSRNRAKKNFNLETWMADLPDNWRMIAIRKLVIPGSHHSMSFGIEKQSPLAGDFAVMELKGIWRVFTHLFSRRVLTRWSRVQGVNLTEQLCMGIRYFDMRVQYDEKSKMIWSVHLMKSDLLSVGLAQVNNFLQSHPKEIVILDFQHFIGFQSSGHSMFKHLLRFTFGDKLCPSSEFSFSKMSLDAMHKKGFQVIVVYRNFGSHDYFSGCFFPIVYSKTGNPSALVNSTISRLSIPWPDKWFLIVHMILKPGRRQLYKRLFSDAHFYARTALNHTRLFVEDLRSSTARPTIIVADCIHLHDAEFSKMVVNLNYSEPTLANRKMPSSSSPRPLGSSIFLQSRKKVKSTLRTSSEEIFNRKRLSSL